MKCPECMVYIEKDEGCDWLQCLNCGVELCWATKGRRWGLNGRDDDTGGCRCFMDGNPCTPKCGGCSPPVFINNHHTPNSSLS